MDRRGGDAAAATAGAPVGNGRDGQSGGSEVDELALQQRRPQLTGYVGGIGRHLGWIGMYSQVN